MSKTATEEKKLLACPECRQTEDFIEYSETIIGYEFTQQKDGEFEYGDSEYGDNSTVVGYKCGRCSHYWAQDAH
jgi:DNA-directed RNA polymerase subunit RPC12/RpoP